MTITRATRSISPLRMPATTSMPPIISAMEIAVPRSGSTSTRPHAKAETTAIGTRSAIRSGACRRAASSAAQVPSRPILASSDGWKVSGPKASQRRAPFTSTPTPGMSTATSRASETTRISGPATRSQAGRARMTTSSATTPASV